MREKEVNGKTAVERLVLASMVDRMRVVPELIEIPGRRLAISARLIAIDYFQDFLRAVGKPVPEYKPEEAYLQVVRAKEYDAGFYCDWLSTISGREFRLPSEEELNTALRIDGLRSNLISRIPLPKDSVERAFLIVEVLKK